MRFINQRCDCARLRPWLRRGSLLFETLRVSKRRLVEAVGVEPTSEELRSAASPCAAHRLISSRTWPVDGRRTGPALNFHPRRSGSPPQPSPSSVAVSRPMDEVSETTWLTKQPERSQCWQLCLPLPFYEGRNSTRCRRPDCSPSKPVRPRFDRVIISPIGDVGRERCRQSSAEGRKPIVDS